MRENNTLHWISPNVSATNKSGLTALPGGVLYFAGSFLNPDSYSYWLTATESPNNLLILATSFTNNTESGH